MSKLPNSERCLTISEAQKYLSIAFSDKGIHVPNINIFDLAFKRQLTLSVRIELEINATKFIEKSFEEFKAIIKEKSNLKATDFVSIPASHGNKGRYWINSYFVENAYTGKSISGIFDLPMIGDERIDVYLASQGKSYGNDKYKRDKGVFLQKGDDLYQLQYFNDFDRDDYAFLSLGRDYVEETLLNDVCSKYYDLKKEGIYDDFWADLPDPVPYFVVKFDALEKFIDSIQNKEQLMKIINKQKQTTNKPDLSAEIQKLREENNRLQKENKKLKLAMRDSKAQKYLEALGVILHSLDKDDSLKVTQGDINAAVQSVCSNLRGYSQSTLETLFSDANKAAKHLIENRE